jgi:hypothetical protein
METSASALRAKVRHVSYAVIAFAADPIAVSCYPFSLFKASHPFLYLYYLS